MAIPEAPTEPRILERSEHPVSRRDIDPRVLRVLYRLIDAGHVAYLVGGGVRDLMIGRRPKDFDVATSAHPQEVRDLFRNSRLIGRRFRLVHVFFGQQNIEVATFRRRAEDVAESEDPLIRHDNTFGTPEEDAFRRDFTINSLFYNPRTFHVIDYAGGVADLEARLIRTIGDPEVRMREDPVRMLRAVRFAAKLGFEIEPATRAAIERHREDLLNASVPRVVEEIYRALGIAAAARAFELMHEFALFDLLLAPLARFLRAGQGPAPRECDRAQPGRDGPSDLGGDGTRALARAGLPVRGPLYARDARRRAARSAGGAETARIRARRHGADAPCAGGAAASGSAVAAHTQAYPSPVFRRGARRVRNRRAHLRRRTPRCSRTSSAIRRRWLEGREAVSTGASSRASLAGPGGSGRRRRRGRRGGRSRHRRRGRAAAHALGALAQRRGARARRRRTDGPLASRRAGGSAGAPEPPEEAGSPLRRAGRATRRHARAASAARPRP